MQLSLISVENPVKTQISNAKKKQKWATDAINWCHVPKSASEMLAFKMSKKLRRCYIHMCPPQMLGIAK
jgi:hypothetical protein